MSVDLDKMLEEGAGKKRVLTNKELEEKIQKLETKLDQLANIVVTLSKEKADKPETGVFINANLKKIVDEHYNKNKPKSEE